MTFLCCSVGFIWFCGTISQMDLWVMDSELLLIHVSCRFALWGFDANLWNIKFGLQDNIPRFLFVILFLFVGHDISRDVVFESCMWSTISWTTAIYLKYLSSSLIRFSYIILVDFSILINVFDLGSQEVMIFAMGGQFT